MIRIMAKRALPPAECGYVILNVKQQARVLCIRNFDFVHASTVSSCLSSKSDNGYVNGYIRTTRRSNYESGKLGVG